VPIAGGAAQLLFHALAQHHAVLIVITEGKGIVRLGAFEADGGDVLEIGIGHGEFLSKAEKV
jgi:hypothetical protein